MSTRQEERDCFICVLLAALPDYTREESHKVFAIADSFMKLARTYQRLAVTACNRHLEPRERRTWLRTGSRINALAQSLGFQTNLGGDPRGYTVKLLLPTRAYNTWGGAEEGLGVPS